MPDAIYDVAPPLAYSLTYVELETPAWSQNTPPDSPLLMTTWLWTVDTDFLPTVTAIQSIKGITYDPATISLGEDLGQRATITVTLSDHRHIMDGESFNDGTFFGKFRARYGLRLRGLPLRVHYGKVGDDFSDMETHHFIVESTEGPSNDGVYKLIAKDVLKLVDDDRAVTPRLSNGFLSADINSAALSLTLLPTGIGNSEYPSSGLVAIGGKEIVSFTRAGDVLTIVRAQYNTTAQDHKANDRVQRCLEYSGVDPADILYDLLTGNGDIPTSYINLTDWQTETSSYLGVVYSALIAEPTGINTLASELIEQMAAAMWWDDIGQKIRLQVLKAVSTTARTYSEENYLADTFEIEEQPDKRISEVQILFGKINPLVKDDEDDNYRSSARVEDTNASLDATYGGYGGIVIRKIRSRWIVSGGRTTAETLANKLLGRYVDPPRRFNFDVQRFTDLDPLLGSGYQLQGRNLQNEDGTAATVPIQIVKVAPFADRFKVEAEEMLWTAFGSDVDPTTRTVTFDFSENSVNLRTRHDQLYPTPAPGDTVNFVVQSGVVIGSSAAGIPAIDVGSWPGGVTLVLTINGRVQGRGGDGGTGGSASFVAQVPGTAGSAGGTAIVAAVAITIATISGTVWGGGGGGGGGGASTDFTTFAIAGSGGGGGSGTAGGTGGVPGFGSTGGGSPGSPGTDTAGGPGGGGGVPGGTGGGPALAGSAGTNGSGAAGGSGGAAGLALSGKAFVNGGAGLAGGDIRGAQT